MDLFDRLRQFEILSHLSGDHLDHFCTCVSRARYDAGQTILDEGEQSRDLFLVDDGQVEISRTTPYGKYPLARLEPGSVFGETSFVDREARSGDAVATEKATLFTVHAESLDRLMEDNQRFAMALYWSLWKSMSEKLRITNQTLAEFFAKGGPKPPESPAEKTATADFKVGIGAKMELFRQQSLSPMEIKFLATLSKERKFDADEYIFREGEEGDRLYVVLDGRVMISKEIVGAGEEALAFLERGDYFGEMALIDDKPRSADAKATEHGAVCLTITREVLEGILDIQKVSSLRLLELLCKLIAKRLREIDDKLVGWFIFSAGSGESLGLPG